MNLIDAIEIGKPFIRSDESSLPPTVYRKTDGTVHKGWDVGAVAMFREKDILARYEFYVERRSLSLDEVLGAVMAYRELGLKEFHHHILTVEEVRILASKLGFDEENI